LSAWKMNMVQIMVVKWRWF